MNAHHKRSYPSLFCRLPGFGANWLGVGTYPRVGKFMVGLEERQVSRWTMALRKIRILGNPAMMRFLSQPFTLRFVDLETKDMEETSNNIFRKLNKLNRELRVSLFFSLARAWHDLHETCMYNSIFRNSFLIVIFKFDVRSPNMTRHLILYKPSIMFFLKQSLKP